MTIISPQTRIVRPENVDSADYLARHTGPLPDGIIISINTLTADRVTYREVEDMRRRIMAVTNSVLYDSAGDPLGLFKLAPCKILEILECIHPGVLTPELEAALTPEQKAWMVDGCYHQVGFHVEPPDDIEQLHNGVGMAMTMLDWWHCTTKSLDPRLHLPAPFSAALAEHHDNLVGDYYATGVAIWHEKLVRLRNDLLVVMRAANTGQDVIKDLDAFRKSGRQSVMW